MVSIALRFESVKNFSRKGRSGLVSTETPQLGNSCEQTAIKTSEIEHLGFNKLKFRYGVKIVGIAAIFNFVTSFSANNIYDKEHFKSHADEDDPETLRLMMAQGIADMDWLVAKYARRSPTTKK
ncbi:Belongs to the complex I LYR [Sparganum proliferum]